MRFPVGHGSCSPRLAVAVKFLSLVGLLFASLQLWKVFSLQSSTHRLAMRQGKRHRVVVWDFSGPAHDEVVLPLMWTLQNLAIPADLYRDTFRPGSREALTSYFTGGIYAYNSLVKQDMTTIDTIILANGDRDTINLLHSGLLDRYPHLRVLAIAHQLPQWDIENADLRALKTKPSEQRFPTGQQLVKVAEYVQKKRWQFIVLSPHMAAGLVRIYNVYPALRSLVDSLAGSVHLFIPVMPVPRAKHELASDAQSFKACIVGQISRSRDYDRIIKTLYRAKKAKPRNWRAPQLIENGQVGNSGPTFLLSILGTVRGRKYYRIPRTLKSMIRESTGIVSFAEFYAELSTANILLPAFTNKERYISEVSSGAIPAAIMARVPVLVDADQLNAYSYLEHPAYILQQEGENEIQAIARLRKTPSGTIAQANATAAWEHYEQKLYERNRQAMLGALGRPAVNVTE